MGLEFEVPYRSLGFNGVPHKSTSFVMPTVNCLVELVEQPSTVITMADVGIVNLERVGFSLRNFDMTFVYKVSRPLFPVVLRLACQKFLPGCTSRV